VAPSREDTPAKRSRQPAEGMWHPAEKTQQAQAATAKDKGSSPQKEAADLERPYAITRSKNDR
jgi:hypothetical protein